MPPRKRRSRRADAVLLVPEPVPAPDPAPRACLDARTARAEQVLSEDGHVLSRRPGDDWRDRLLLVWSPRDACPSCGKHRVVLSALSGEAGVCDVLAEVAYLASLGWCTCPYAPKES